MACCTAASSAHADQPQAEKVEWDDDNWRRVKWPEALVSVALAGSIFAIDALPYPDHPTWRGPILFDDSARSFFKGSDDKAQRLASTTSDYIFFSMAAAPFIVDNYFVALGVHQSVDVAAQMTLIDMQSFGLAGLFTLSTEHLVGRARPPFSDCGSGEPSADPSHCSRTDNFRSFYAGHPAATFTSAGLTCAHHQNLPLYGGGLPDVFACVTMVGLATTTSVLRMTADRHWASDVIVGAAVGVGSGYFLPSLLHYRLFQKKKVDTAVKTSFGYVAPIPVVLEKGGGLGVVGVF